MLRKRNRTLFSPISCQCRCCRGLRESIAWRIWTFRFLLDLCDRLTLIVNARLHKFRVRVVSVERTRGIGSSFEEQRSRGNKHRKNLDKKTQHNTLSSGIVPSVPLASCRKGQQPIDPPWRLCILSRTGFTWLNYEANDRFAFLVRPSSDRRETTRFSLRLRRSRGFVQQTQVAWSLAALAIKGSFSFAIKRGVFCYRLMSLKSIVLFSIPAEIVIPFLFSRVSNELYLFRFTGGLSRDGRSCRFGGLAVEIARTRIERLLKIIVNRLAKQLTIYPENLIVSSFRWLPLPRAEEEGW